MCHSVSQGDTHDAMLFRYNKYNPLIPYSHPAMKKYSAKEYKKELRDPRFLQYARDRKYWGGNKCENELCESSSTFCGLEIHHLHYGENDSGERLRAWEYPFQSVQVLCRKCHQLATLNHAVQSGNTRLAKQIKKEMAIEQLWLRFENISGEAA